MFFACYACLLFWLIGGRVGIAALLCSVIPTPPHFISYCSEKAASLSWCLARRPLVGAMSQEDNFELQQILSQQEGKALFSFWICLPPLFPVMGGNGMWEQEIQAPGRLAVLAGAGIIAFSVSCVYFQLGCWYCGANTQELAALHMSPFKTQHHGINLDIIYLPVKEDSHSCRITMIQQQWNSTIILSDCSAPFSWRWTSAL